MTDSVSPTKLGIFGGSFDPIHVGHLLIAELAREQLQLDSVCFIPAARSPLKPASGPSADGRQRLEMVQLAISGNPHFTVDDRELRRGGASYTIETLRELAAENPDSQLSLIIGSDSLSEFHQWREPAAICETAFVAILARGGQPPPDLSLLSPFLPAHATSHAHQHLLAMPQIEISSSDLRERISAERSTRYQLHPAVEAYIHAHGLYQG